MFLHHKNGSNGENVRMKLGRYEIGPELPIFFIAEMSGNHNQSLEKALQIVEAAKDAGAHALKLQTYRPETMTLDIETNEFFISDNKSLWKGRSLYDLYREAMTPWEWHRPIMEKCHQLGLEFFSTPFDATSVDFLETLNIPFYKIASFELTDLPLIARVARTGKPIIMSTGMAKINEIHEAVTTARENGAKDLVLLKCTSSYPAPVEHANLRTITNLKDIFGTEVGLSDHTMGNSVPITAAILGATVIEKHFTLKRSDGGVDSAFSLEPNEFKSMIEEVNKAKQAIGHVSYGPTEAELKSLVFRRSIYVSEDVRAGEVLTEKNLKIIRPSLGLPPKFWDIVIGRRARGDYKKGTPLTWDKI